MTEPEKEYLTLAELAELVGVKRGSLYYYFNALNIEMHKFNLDRRSYVSLADAKRIKEIKDKPWTAGNRKTSEKLTAPPVISTILDMEVPQKEIIARNPGGAPKVDIPDSLPPGTIRLIDFISKHGLPQSSMSYYISKGFKGEKIKTTTIPRPSGSGGVTHLLTPEQQEKALDFLKRHGKLKKEEEPVAEESAWYLPDGE